ncbi:MAG: LPXTG cell wall anchor domain-containing protein [Microbacteriaceae bacterium]
MRLTQGIGAAVATAAAALLTLGIVVPAQAAPEDGVLASAVGMEMFDVDLGTLVAPTPVAEWSSGQDVGATHEHVDDVFKLNTSQASGLSATAGAEGAQAQIASGEFQLRDRPAIEFEGLSASCGPDGAPTLGLDRLTIDGVDLTDEAVSQPGWRYDLPDSIWGPTYVMAGEVSTAPDGSTTMVGLRIQGELGASEIARVRLGTVTCAEAAAWPEPQPIEPTDPVELTEPVVTGVTVTAPDGSALIAGKPRVEGLGESAQSDDIAAADDYPTSANGVHVATNDDGGAHVRIDEFTQIPDADQGWTGELLPSALRVYGLTVKVTADGEADVQFDDVGDAVFVNGVWINTSTDLYTGLDAEGNERVRIRFGERVENPDGTVTVVGLRYEDLTGTYPELRLGEVRLPGDGVPTERASDAWGVAVTSPDRSELIAPQPRVEEAGQSQEAALIEADGFPSVARDVSVSLGEESDAAVSVGSFEQVPNQGTDAMAEYRWQALRVYGMTATVDAAGEMTVEFADSGNAVFVNGVWINTSTDLYTGLDAEGNERVRIRFGERIENPDGSIILTALHYEDLTGTYPEVRIGQVTIAASDVEPEKPDDEPDEPEKPSDPALEDWYAFGVQATGASHLAPQPVVQPTHDEPQSVVDRTITDSAAGQIRVGGVDLTSAPQSGTAAAEEIVLFPSTSVEVRLADLSVSVDGADVTVTSSGGTVAGQTVAAGEIAPNTSIALPNGGRVVLAGQNDEEDARTVTGLRFLDAAGLSSDIAIAVVTSKAVAPEPDDDANPPTDGGSDSSDGNGGSDAGDGGGNVTVPGALSPDGTSPAGTGGTGSLAATGSDLSPVIPAAAALLLILGAALTVFRRRNRIDVS